MREENPAGGIIGGILLLASGVLYVLWMVIVFLLSHLWILLTIWLISMIAYQMGKHSMDGKINRKAVINYFTTKKLELGFLITVGIASVILRDDILL